MSFSTKMSISAFHILLEETDWGSQLESQLGTLRLSARVIGARFPASTLLHSSAHIINNNSHSMIIMSPESSILKGRPNLGLDRTKNSLSCQDIHANRPNATSPENPTTPDGYCANAMRCFEWGRISRLPVKILVRVLASCLNILIAPM